MIRTIGLTLLCAAVSISTPVYSTRTHSLQQGLTVEYDLPPHDPQVFTNYMFWSVEANCTVISEQENTGDTHLDLFTEALRKKGTINGITLSAGQNMLLRIHSGESLNLRAESGAKVQITNMSDYQVHAICVS